MGFQILPEVGGPSLTQSQVDARIAPFARVGNTSIISKSKLPRVKRRFAYYEDARTTPLLELSEGGRAIVYNHTFSLDPQSSITDEWEEGTNNTPWIIPTTGDQYLDMSRVNENEILFIRVRLRIRISGPSSDLRFRSRWETPSGTSIRNQIIEEQEVGTPNPVSVFPNRPDVDNPRRDLNFRWTVRKPTDTQSANARVFFDFAFNTFNADLEPTQYRARSILIAGGFEYD